MSTDGAQLRVDHPARHRVAAGGSDVSFPGSRRKESRVVGVGRAQTYIDSLTLGSESNIHTEKTVQCMCILLSYGVGPHP